jgi:hypothetical protein
MHGAFALPDWNPVTMRVAPTRKLNRNRVPVQMEAVLPRGQARAARCAALLFAGPDRTTDKTVMR